MKKYLFSLLVSTSINFCYAAPVAAIIPDYESNIVNVKKNIDNSPLPLQTKEEINVLLDIFLKNITNAKDSGKEVDIFEEQNNTLNERNAQLEKEDPAVFQKILEVGDASQFLQELISYIMKAAGGNDIKTTIGSHRLIKLIKTLRLLNTDDHNPLPPTVKQQRDKFLQIFEDKLQEAGENVNLGEQAQKTFEEMQKQMSQDNETVSKKMWYIASANQLFIGFIDYLRQSVDTVPAKGE